LAKYAGNEYKLELKFSTKLATKVALKFATKLAGDQAKFYSDATKYQLKYQTKYLEKYELKYQTKYSQKFYSKVFSNGKRTESATCNCLDTVLSCLQGTTCTSQPVLTSLCNWNYGRLFGDCTPCSGLVQGGDGYATATDLLTRFQEYQSSLTAVILQLVPEISALSFSPDTTTSLLATVTLASGVVDSEDAYNQIVYQMAHVFDVYPLTISWAAVPASGKRQSSNQIIVNFYDEQVPSSPSPAFVPAFVAVLIAGLLRLL
jgi:hypothetical protein